MPAFFINNSVFVDKTENLCITVRGSKIEKEVKKMKIYSCETHINRALDEFVALEETFPSMEKVEESEKLSTTCHYCDGDAAYLVTNV